MASSSLNTGHGHRCVGGCNNDQRYPDKLDVKNHVEKLTWHRVPRDEDKRNAWKKTVSKGREGFTPGNETFVCSNHFVDGKPSNPNPYPTLYLTEREQREPQFKQRKAPQNRKPENKGKLSLTEGIVRVELKL